MTEAELTELTGRLAEALGGELDEGALRRRVKGLVRRAEKERGETVVGRLLPAWEGQLDERAERFANADAAMADLANWMGLRRRGLGDLQSAIGWFFDHYAAALTVLGLLATAFYGLAYATFYHAVDSSPNRLG
jgi:hypothetical protein